MTKKQYLKVIEQIITSPRSDLQKISRLQDAFELYNRHIIYEFEQLAKDYRHEENVGFFDMCIDIVENDKTMSSNRRLIKCYKDSERMWQYYSKEANLCGCGSNCLHYEYDTKDNMIYGVCNACNTDISVIIEDKYVRDELCTGKWLSKHHMDFKR